MHIDHHPWELRSQQQTAERSRLAPPPSHSKAVAATRSPWLFRVLHPPSRFGAAVADAIGWVVIPAMCRVGLQFVMAHSVHLWLPGILVLTLPAWIGAALSSKYPECSVAIGYRLVLVMFGLLLGGRL